MFPRKLPGRDKILFLKTFKGELLHYTITAFTVIFTPIYCVYHCLLIPLYYYYLLIMAANLSPKFLFARRILYYYYYNVVGILHTLHWLSEGKPDLRAFLTEELLIDRKNVVKLKCIVWP